KLGAAEVLVSARHDHQRQQALRLGAAAVFSADRDGRAALRAAAEASDVDVVLETVGGSAPTLRQAVQVIGPRGTVVILGLFDNDPPYPALAAMLKEVRVVGSMVYNRPQSGSDFGLALEILRDEAASL